MTARVRALGALLVIAVILAGVPLLLLAIDAGPVPDLFTSWDRTRIALTSPDDGTLLLALARVIAWMAWAVLAGALLIEIGSRARGIPAPHLPALSLPQGAARVLVTAAAAVFLVAQPASAALRFPPAAVVVTAPAAAARGGAGNAGPGRPDRCRARRGTGREDADEGAPGTHRARRTVG